MTILVNVTYISFSDFEAKYWKQVVIHFCFSTSKWKSNGRKVHGPNRLNTHSADWQQDAGKHRKWAGSHTVEGTETTQDTWGHNFKIKQEIKESQNQNNDKACEIKIII